MHEPGSVVVEHFGEHNRAVWVCSQLRSPGTEEVVLGWKCIFSTVPEFCGAETHMLAFTSLDSSQELGTPVEQTPAQRARDRW